MSAATLDKIVMWAVDEYLKQAGCGTAYLPHIIAAVRAKVERNDLACASRTTSKRIYIAGPMRGTKDFNFPAFYAAADELRAKGYEVFNPAEHDENIHGSRFNISPTGDLADIAHTTFNLRETLKHDLSWMAENATAIALLPGWEKSRGANAEYALAHALSLEIIHIK